MPVTLVFIDADLSPLSSRQGANKKLTQKAKERLLPLLTREEPIVDDPTFVTRLTNYIDILTRPVIDGDSLMTIGMPARNPLIDGLRKGLNWGAFGGNRAVSYEVWCEMIQACKAKNVEITGWEIEAALNSYMRKQRNEDGVKLNRYIGKTILDGVVNVGSGVKAGGVFKGVKRLMHVQKTSMTALVKYDRVFAN